MSDEPFVGDGRQLMWFKSSYSTGEPGSDCVEIAAAAEVVHVRDSKDAAGARLRFAPSTWAEFVGYASGH